MKYALFCICLFLTGCSSLISSTFNIGNKVAPVLMDERELSDDIKDIQTNLAIRSRLTAEKAAYGLDVEITVFEGEVLINGAIPSIDDIEKIIEIVWQTENVENVYNYLRLEEPSDIIETSDDALIASGIRTQLGLTQDISSTNYKMTVDNHVLYIIGIAKNQKEFDTVMDIIYTTDGIEKVICHVRKSYQ